MKTIENLRNRKGVSPVIATVILVAVTITVAVAVAYWMSGIAGQYTSFEKVEIQSSYATKTTFTGTDPFAALSTGWTVVIKIKNTGSATSTLIEAFVNDKPITEYSDTTQTIVWEYDLVGTSTPMPVDGLTIESGVSMTIYLYIEAFRSAVPTDITFSSGTTINLKFHSAAGMDYIKLVQLV